MAEINFEKMVRMVRNVAEAALDNYGKTIRECIKIIAEQNQKFGEWTPVSEGLPKAGEYVDDVAKHYLVQNEYGDMMVARYTHSEYWEQIYQLKPIKDEIVAWMPLPEPYKAESEDI